MFYTAQNTLAYGRVETAQNTLAHCSIETNSTGQSARKSLDDVSKETDVIHSTEHACSLQSRNSAGQSTRKSLEDDVQISILNGCSYRIS